MLTRGEELNKSNLEKQLTSVSSSSELKKPPNLLGLVLLNLLLIAVYRNSDR